MPESFIKTVPELNTVEQNKPKLDSLALTPKYKHHVDSKIHLLPPKNIYIYFFLGWQEKRLVDTRSQWLLFPLFKTTTDYLWSSWWDRQVCQHMTRCCCQVAALWDAKSHETMNREKINCLLEAPTDLKCDCFSNPLLTTKNRRFFFQGIL